MASILSAAQITTLRKVWLPDLVDVHAEIGTAGTVASGASVGATSLALTGLGSGTIATGTRIRVSSQGQWTTYRVTADVLIALTAATVTISPSLYIAATTGDVVAPIADRLSSYNKKEGRQYFADADLVALATRATQWRAREIADADDPDEVFLKATAILGIRQMLSDSGFRDTLAANGGQESANATLAELAKREQRYEMDISPREFGPHTVSMIR